MNKWVLIFLTAAVMPLTAEWQEFPVGPGESVWATSSLTETLGGREVTYGPEALFDGDFSTPWVESAEGSGAGESVTILLKAPVSEITLVNGFAASERLFFLNHRVRKIGLSLLAGLTAPGMVTEQDYRMFLVREYSLEDWDLRDLREPQVYSLGVSCGEQEEYFDRVLRQFQSDQEFLFRMIREDLGDLYQEGSPPETRRLIQEIYGFLALRLTVKEVYPGSRYDDTCISEIILK